MNHPTKSLVPFDFHGDQIDVVQDGDDLWVSVRRVCEALEIDRKSQQKKLQDAPWARGVIITLPDARNHNQKAFLVDIETLPMWLSTISTSKVAEHIRPKLVTYQREVKKVLADHFLPKRFTSKQPITKIEHLAQTRTHSSLYLGARKKQGLIAEHYFMRYVEHSLASIDGTIPAPGPRLIDVSSFLESKSLGAETIRRYAPKFGKLVKKFYVEEYGAEPGKVHRYINHSERLVNSHTENHLPLFETAFQEMFGPFVPPQAALPTHVRI